MATTWFAQAEVLAGRMVNAPPGKRELELERFGSESGKKAATLRSYLAARAYLLALRASNPDLADRLKGVPPVSVEVLRRWHARDPERAREAAEYLLHGRYTMRTLVAAERASRTGSEAVSLRGKEAWRAALLDGKPCFWIRGVATDVAPERADDAGAEAIVGGALRSPQGLEETFKADLCAGEGAAAVPCLLVGPYDLSALYVRRSTDWCLRAMGLAALWGRAALLLPTDCPTAPYAALLRDADRLRPSEAGAKPGVGAGLLVAHRDGAGWRPIG